jgi:hypothetical protein
MAVAESVEAPLETPKSTLKLLTCPIPPDAPATTVNLKFSYFYTIRKRSSVSPYQLLPFLQVRVIIVVRL